MEGGTKRGTNKALGKYYILKVITVWTGPDCAALKITNSGPNVAVIQISVGTNASAN